MEIVNIRTMRGPNYWSDSHHKLIVMKLEVGETENYSSDQLNILSDRIKAIFDNNLVNYTQGDSISHLVLNTILSFQSISGYEAEYHHIYLTNEEDIINIIFSYQYEEAGRYAGTTAVKMIEGIINGEDTDLKPYIEELQRIKRRVAFGPSTQSIVSEAAKRDIPYTRLNNNSLIMFGQGCNQRLIKATMTGNTSSIGVELASDKDATKRILANAYITVPKGELALEEEELDGIIERIGFPLVLKPLNANHGRGITININEIEKALEAFRIAQKISDFVIVEKYIKGSDYRFLVINYKLVAVAKRTPAKIIGDGISTIQQLLEVLNSDPKRGDGHENVLTKIIVDDITLKILAEKDMNLQSVLPSGSVVFLKDTANLSTGGTARDVTDMVHKDNVLMAERIARLMKLDICGIDIIAENISNPITVNHGAVIEVNACPGFRMHLSPTHGLPRNVAEAVVDSFYPNAEPSRIPIVAVTGTNGKTTTTRLVAHAMSSAGKSVGFTTTDGIYLNGQLVFAGDCSGPTSAATIFRDPAIDFAVLECARGGILRAGLGFDKCNVSVITNVSGDHLGLNDINTIEELANVKSVVAKSTLKEGYAVLNADDDLVYKMKEELKCKVALFSLNAENARIREHCAEGGLAATIENGYFIICKGPWKLKIIKVVDVPLSFMGTSSCMIQNILASILAIYVSSVKIKQIAEALKIFKPSPHTTPGRMNLFEFNNFRLLVDYAHNEGGYIELKKYIDQIEASVKIGIVAATGDRRDEDIRKVGFYAAKMFDKIIIRHDRDGRGKTNEQLTALILEGIKTVNSDMDVEIISDEFEAVRHVVKDAQKGSFIVFCADHVLEILSFISELQKNENRSYLPAILDEGKGLSFHPS